MSTLLVLAAGIALLAIIVAGRPDEFHISRAATMSAPASVIFDQINDLHKWEGWSPWAKLDPQAKNSFEGSPSGSGAIMRWVGNNKVGEGSMTITESRPGEFVRLKLEFLKPFRATNSAEFVFKPVADGTSVTWSMSGENSFTGKAMSLIMNADRMIGGQFEEGLEAMKSIVEGKGRARS